MVSEPDYDPNNPRQALDPSRINRLTTGVFEMGSTFKAFTVAMALDSGKTTLKSTFDARVPLHMGRFDIHDFEAQRRILSVPEIFDEVERPAVKRLSMAERKAVTWMSGRPPSGDTGSWSSSLGACKNS